LILSAASRTLSFGVIGLLASSGTGESPWLWLIIPAGGLALYLLDRSRSLRGLGFERRRAGQPMERVPGTYPAPRWLQAGVSAAIGGWLLYYLATGHEKWYWWFAATAAWLNFGSAVVRRKRLG
jgi:hypothetical protein